MFLLIFFAVLVLLLPHGTLENLAMIGVVITGTIALWQALRTPRRRRTRQRQQVPQGPRAAAKPRPTPSLPAVPRQPQQAPKQSRVSTIEVIYIGRRFYSDSHTEMGPMYAIDSQGNWDRYTIGSIEQAVEHGAIVGVRKATAQEMAQAEQMLVGILRTQERRQQNEY